MSFKISTTKSTGSSFTPLEQLTDELQATDTILIGAGAGLSASAGFEYSGKRFHQYFADFEAAYGFHDMYAGGFYPFPTPEEQWAYWSRFIFLNRYCSPPKPVYQAIRKLVQDKDFFVLTTNVDHCFQKAGFDKRRLFYTQGDYGLWQCSRPCHSRTYDNEETVRKMVKAQGFAITEEGLRLPEGNTPKRSVPSELVPRCPVCGAPMSMNLRADETFVQDAGWYAAADRYHAFVRQHQNGPILYLEVGVGWNTPGIIKYNFWQQVYHNPQARYVCINKDSFHVPKEIARRSLYLEADAADVLPG